MKGAGMSIRFFLPEELYELWNQIEMSRLMQATAEEEEAGLLAEDCAQTVEELNESPMRHIGYAEGFLAPQSFLTLGNHLLKKADLLPGSKEHYDHVLYLLYT